MLRLTLLIVFSIAVSVSGALLLLNNKTWNSVENESVRQSRIQLQHARQSVGLVEMAIGQNMLGSLSQDKDSLTVELAVSLRELAKQRSQYALVFEQHQGTDISFAEVDMPVSVLVLNVQFIASHAPMALHLLDEIGEATGAWPVEVRACEFIRAKQGDLSVNGALSVKCTLHIYHWAMQPELSRL
ncbi:MAG: hypothetical protein AB8B63_20130 [Granulosicoccus sp.]